MMMSLLGNITNFSQNNFTEVILNGDPVVAVFGTYYNLIGALIFVVIYAVIFTLLSIKTRNLGMTSIVMIAYSVVVGAAMPSEMLAIMFMLIAVSFGALFIAILEG